MMDANFKLKSKKNKSRSDIELASGWSYFVETTTYEKHIKEHEEEKDVSYFELEWQSSTYLNRNDRFDTATADLKQ